MYAFDADGEIFWQDVAEQVSEESIATAMGLGQYKALHPKLITLTKAACKQVPRRKAGGEVIALKLAEE